MHPQDAEALGRTLLSGTYPDTDRVNIAAAAGWIADSICTGAAPPEAVALRRAMRLLNDRLLFEHSRLLGNNWTQCREFDAEIAKRHAQALIELSALDRATVVLRTALNEVTRAAGSVSAGAERLEYEGLLGRIAKQRFAMTGDKDALAEATDRYLAQYEAPDHPYWHGINAVATMARERREGINRKFKKTPIALARVILRHVARQYDLNSDDVWLPATASEASLALDDCSQAELWLYRFLHHPNSQPFHVNSYNRQLQEIWQGSAVGAGTSCADRLAGIVARHLARTQGRWSVSPNVLQRAAQEVQDGSDALEKNFSGETGFSVDTLKKMLGACASIGCVTNVAGERLGTGFLVDGAYLKASLGDQPVFVTNAHVISDAVKNAIHPTKALITFEIESTEAGMPRFYAVDGDVLFTSPPGPLGGPVTGALDVTVVRLQQISGTYKRLPTSPALPLIEARAKAYVVGHPRGSGLQISLHDSLLLDVDDSESLLHYRTPTDPGSSGSPVFNSEWEVIALHHSGSSKTPRLHGTGHYEANEGIALSAIRAAMSA